MAEKIDIRKKLTESASLPSLPAAAVHVLQLTNTDDTSIDDLADVISKDPALSAKVLRAVNSAFYGLNQKVSSVPQAVALLGMHSVRTLVLSFTLVSTMQTQKGAGFNHMKYWRRSMYAATAARVIAERVLPYKVEDCFIAALLMDIGMLVMDQLLGEQYSDVMERAKTHPELIVAESHYVGITHPEVVSTLGKHWQLPEVLVMPMASHHAPMELEDHLHKQIAQVIWLGGRCADIFIDEPAAADSIASVRKTCRQLYQLDDLACDGMLCKVGQRTRELANIFEIKLNTPTEYEDVLTKASQRLLELSIGEEEQMVELQDKRRANRVQRNGAITVVPCTRGTLLPARQVRLRDISASGIGITDPMPMELGSQFVIKLPQASGTILTMLYTVRRCDAVSGLHSIGAELHSVLRPASGEQPAAAALGAATPKTNAA